MERRQSEFIPSNILFVVMCFLVLPWSARSQLICSSPSSTVFIEENNQVGAVVVTITTLSNVTLSFLDPQNQFTINGNQIIASSVLDHEQDDNHVILIGCTQAGSSQPLIISVAVIVTDVNDNGPVFSKSLYYLNITELLPIGDIVGSYRATDVDSTTLYYNLVSEPAVFALQPDSPNIVVQSTLDYDTVKNVKLTLYAQDTPNPTPEGEPSFTATATIMVSIKDDDNRPPWFQPCTIFNIEGNKICQSSGYTGSVVVTEQEVGALRLSPGPLIAVDGDSGINSEITYSFLDGNTENLFAIDANSGDITMRQAADVPGQIILTVLASQKDNSFQFATTKVTIKVVSKNLHEPQFENQPYNGFVSSLGSMVLDLSGKNQPLVILAKDQDFNETGGVNPAITYTLTGSSPLTLIGGYIFLTEESPPATFALQVEAEDTSTGDSARADVVVEVTSGLPSTSVAPSTSNPLQTNGTAVPTTHGSPSTVNTSVTTHGSPSTVNTGVTTHGSPSTVNTSVTTHGSPSTVNTGVTTLGTLPTVNTGVTTLGTLPTVNTGVTTLGTLPTVNTGVTTLGTLPTVNTGVTTLGTLPTVNTGVTTLGTLPTVNTGVTTLGTLPTVNTGVTTRRTPPTVTTIGTHPTVTPSDSIATTDPSVTTVHQYSTSTAHPNTGGVINPSGGYSPKDMAALGASLAVLLFISLGIIGILIYHIQKGKADWWKVTEASIFRSSLGRGSGGTKDGVQYTNEAFNNDEDSVSTWPAGLKEFNLKLSAGPASRAGDGSPGEDVILKSATTLLALPEDTSQAAADKAESEREVKPILTKERRMEEGYKSVWFKEDIVPDAKEEVLIIPDNGEQDGDEEEQDGAEEEEGSLSSGNDEDTLIVPRPKVVFRDADADSGLGVRELDSVSDSENNEVQTSDL